MTGKNSSGKGGKWWSICPLLLLLLTWEVAQLPARAAASLPAAPVPTPTGSELSSPEEIFPLSKVQPGLPLQGFTVFQGTELTPFEGKVLSVLPQAIGTQSLILAELKGAGLEETGIVAGMSGSPVFYQNQLVGAVAYGWTFSKKPIAGITPAQDLRALFPREEGKALLEYASFPNLLDFVPGHLSLSSRLDPLLTPLMVSSSLLTETLSARFAPYGLYPVTSPSLNAYSDRGFPLRAGSVIGIPLISGDFQMAAIGTVTYCKAESCVAFGHPFFGLHHVKLPATGGFVHAVISTLQSSFKIASPGKITATLVGEGQAGILIQKKEGAPLIPATFQVNGRRFHLQLAKLSSFLPLLYQVGLAQALFEETGVPSDMTVHAKITLTTPQGDTTLSDSFYAEEPGFKPAILVRLQDLLQNPFGEVTVQKISTTIEATPGRKTAELLQFTLPKKTYRRGEKVTLRLALSVYPGKIVWQNFTFPLPESPPQNTLELMLLSGQELKSQIQLPPTNFQQWLNYYSHWYESNDLVIAISTSGKEVGLSGEPLPSLPETLLGIFSESESVQGLLYPEIQIYSFPTPYILSGKIGGILHLEETP